MSHAAQLSIVVVATNLLQVRACVESIAVCAALNRAEIVIVSALDCSSLGASFPRLQIVRAEASWSLPQIRAAGLSAVASAWAAVLSEDYRVAKDWAEAVLLPRERIDVLVGEVIWPDTGFFARATYLWEYLHLAAPSAAGKLSRRQARWAPAGGVVYRMSTLEIDAISAARSEMDYHGALFDSGGSFHRDPRVQVRYAPPLQGFLMGRFRRSREWARTQASSQSLVLRWFTGLTRLALPAVLLGRFALRTAVRPRYWGQAIVATPFALLFAWAETIGELRGYFGRSV